MSELDHWGKFEAEMLQAGEDIRRIRDEERESELLEYTKELNTTQTDYATELSFMPNMQGLAKIDVDKCLIENYKKDHAYICVKLKMWKMMAQKIEKNENYLYDCSLPMYYNVESIDKNKLINESHFRWFNVWFFSSFTCIFVALSSFKSKLLKDIHPSQLIGAMSVFFLMTNWHIFIWKLGEVDMVCYIGVESWLISLVKLFGGTITHEKAIDLLVHAN